MGMDVVCAGFIGGSELASLVSRAGRRWSDRRSSGEWRVNSDHLDRRVGGCGEAALDAEVGKPVGT